MGIFFPFFFPSFFSYVATKKTVYTSFYSVTVSFQILILKVDSLS